MLTPLYNARENLKRLAEQNFSSTAFPFFNLWRIIMGILSWAASADRLSASVSDVADLFQVTPSAAYKNIRYAEEALANVGERSAEADDLIHVDKHLVDKTILTLALDAQAPIEGIMRALLRILGPRAARSKGYISQKLKEAGAFVKEHIDGKVDLSAIEQGAIDELYEGNDKPVFTCIDPDSTYIFGMEQHDDRKGGTWKSMLDGLKAQGLNLKVILSDAGSGLRKGSKDAFPDAAQQSDVFHVLKDLGGSVYRFKDTILAKLNVICTLEDRISRDRKHWTDKYKKMKQDLRKATKEMEPLYADYEEIGILYCWVRELVGFSGYTRSTVEKLIDDLLARMDDIASRDNAYNLRREIERFRSRLPSILTFLDRLFARFHEEAAKRCVPVEAFHILYQRHGTRCDSVAHKMLTQELEGLIGKEKLREIEKEHNRILGHIKRASSIVENVNGRIRVFMDIKRHMSGNFYCLLKAYLNHKKYHRSRIASRKGKSPIELLTGEHHMELIDLLEAKGFFDPYGITAA